MPTLADLLAVPHQTGPLVTPASPGCSSVTWQALVRDGHLVVLREGYALVAGCAETAGLRAGTFVDELPAGLVLARSWAAWVHAGGDAPRGVATRPCVVYEPGTSRPRAVPGLVAVQARLRPWDVEAVAGLRVTTPTRTAMDVATWADDAEAARLLPRLAASGVDLEGARAQLDRVAGWRGAQRARDRLEAAVRAGLPET